MVIENQNNKKTDKKKININNEINFITDELKKIKISNNNCKTKIKTVNEIIDYHKKRIGMV